MSIQKETIIKIVCNAGVLMGKVIGVSRGQYATVGSVVTISAAKVLPNNSNKITKGSVFKAVIVRTKEIVKYNGFSVQGSVNAGVIIKNNGEKLGTAIKGYTTPFLKDHPLAKGVSNSMLGALLNVK